MQSKRWLIVLPLGALLLLSVPANAVPPADPFTSPLAPTPTPSVLNWTFVPHDEWVLLGRTHATYYGNNVDGYLGRPHASSWHGRTPPGFSEAVTRCCEPGIALSTAWGVEFGDDVLVVWEQQNIAVRAVRVDAKPGIGADLYEWLYREMSPLDIGPLDIALYARRPVGAQGILYHDQAETPDTNRALTELQQERWRRYIQISHNREGRGF